MRPHRRPSLVPEQTPRRHAKRARQTTHQIHADIEMPMLGTRDRLVVHARPLRELFLRQAPLMP